MKAIKELHIKIPDDISFICFDDFNTAEFIEPPLTTIKQPVDEFGIKSMKMLLKIIKGERLRNRLIELKPELIVRNSCKNIS